MDLAMPAVASNMASTNPMPSPSPPSLDPFVPNSSNLASSSSNAPDTSAAQQPSSSTAGPSSAAASSHVSVEAPSETPHDLYCQARDLERRSRPQEAANLYHKASMNGHLSAMVAYATHLVPTDEKAAFVWFRAAAERGDPRAWYELGQLLARGRCFEVNAIDAARCWKRAAQMGDNTGKSALGLCYIRGFGVKQDPEKGVEIVKQVADVHNDVTAMKNLAWIYRHGKGVQKDLEAAAYWDDRAKKQEDIMRHVTSREQVLFGRGRLRSSKHKGRDAEKSSRPGTRENSISDRVPTPDPEARQSKERDSFKSGRPLQGDELEGTLRDAPREVREDVSVPPAPVDENPPREERSMPPAPLHNTPLPNTIEGDTRAAEAINASSPINSVYETNSPTNDIDKNVDINVENDIQPTPEDHTATERHHEPTYNQGVAGLPYGSNEPDPEAPPREYAQPRGVGGLSSMYEDGAEKISNRPDANLPPSSIPQMPSDQYEERFEATDEGFEDIEQDVKAKRMLPGGGEVHINKEVPANDAETELEESEDREKVAATVGTLELSANQNARPKDALVIDPPRNIGPIVASQRKIFEAEIDANKDSLQTSVARNDIETTPQHPTNPAPETYAAPGEPEATVQTSSSMNRDTEFAETFDNEDPKRDAGPSGHVPEAFDNVEEHVAPSQASTGRDDSATVHTQNTDMLLQNVSVTNMDSAEPQVDADMLENLHHVLTNYPRNPMRADSLSTLKSLVQIIQEVPLTNSDAFGIVQKNVAMFKVVVAMVSQHEDEHIQEHGLHCILRIIRVTPMADKEVVTLTPYGDCFKTVQGSADVIVPKGTTGIIEDLPGVIQAIVSAMRHHATVRRIQLAGCAALNEVASISPACRSAALEQGTVNLLLACLRHRSTPSAAVIHEMAARAISSFCNGKENTLCKEAFTSAGVIGELLSVLQLWGHNEEGTSDLMTNATFCCCGGLRHVTDGYPRAAIQCVQSFAYHYLIKIMVLRRDDVDICRVVLAALTSITRNAGSAAEKPLNDAKPLPEVLATMEVHSENSLFIRKALDFMEALGSYVAMRDEIVVAGGIKFAADIIEQDANDPILLERACGLVEKLCRGSPPNQEIFSSQKGMKSLTTLLNRYSRQPGVVERAVLAMTSVSTNNAASQREAQVASAPEELVRILKFYSSKNSKVVAACAGAMSALVVPKNTSMAQVFARLEAPELMVRAMKRHPDNVTVQENGSAAVAAFCEADPHIMSSLLKSGITNILVVALQRFLHKQTAVVQIVRAMRAITNEVIPDDSYRFKSKLLTDRSNESSLPEIFHTALSYHKRALPDTANVIISICATINRLCMRSVAFKNEVGKDGIVEELKRLVERTAEYKDLGALQPVLATICTLVLESEENKNRFHAAGGVEAILDVMQKWNHDTYVLEHCCAALRYSCNDHFGNCTEVKNHNGVRSILGVMEMHPENVNVTLWCCLTLADLCKGDEELQSSATVVQGIRKVVSAMSMFASNSRFLSSACEFLRAASVCNQDNQERIVRLGGRTAIVKALENHPTDSTLTESAAYALLQIQDIPDTRTSVDSSPQVGLVKRLSRDLRRSGSSSNRSNRSSKSKLGRKSLSFTSRRRTGEIDDDTARSGPENAELNDNHHEYHDDPHAGGTGGIVDDEDEMGGNMRRSGKTSSFKNLQRMLMPRRRSRIERSSERDMEMDQQRHHQQITGADDGYGEYDNYGGAQVE